MEKNREMFMENAGDIFFEMKENELEANGVEAPLVTNSTGFLSIYCCQMRQKGKMLWHLAFFLVKTSD